MPDTSFDAAARPEPAAGGPGRETAAARRPRWSPSAWPSQVLAPLGYWACTRLLMVMSVFSSHENSQGEVHKLYEKWAAVLLDGSYPIGDPTWQYPPGAAGVILAPEAVPGVNYVQGFVVVVFLADLVIVSALLWFGSRPGRRLSGAWIWILALPLMLYIPYARYDVIVTLFAVLALLTLQGRPWLGGGVAALGAMVKVWPAFAVFGVPWGRSLRSAAAGFVASAVALTAIMSLLFEGPFDFLHAQGGRGIEFESLPGSALLVAHHFGYHGEISYRYGSLEIVGPYVERLGTIMVLCSVAGFLWLLLWRARARVFSDATPADAALAAMLVFVTTSRVISPQYFIWLVGVGAVCLSYRSTVQRPVVLLLVGATALTTVEFPLFWQSVIAGHAGFGAVLAARNVLLVTATVLACVRLWRSSVPRRRRAETADPVPGATG
ncbi:membrane protein [Kitasatospora sp. NE20-6]|uniref:glycosyltransferase 87 family protein n=1 Tax=Kitasatospora sp. NE20-6 TaxID=2859066 RepID=UPI0034DBB58F